MGIPSRRVVAHAAALAVACLFGAQLHAQTVTATKTAERSFGDWISCAYEGAGREFYRAVKYSQSCPRPIRAALRDSARRSAAIPARAFKTGESMVGAVRQCQYEFVGRVFTQTVEYGQPCPRSIPVR